MRRWSIIAPDTLSLVSDAMRMSGTSRWRILSSRLRQKHRLEWGSDPHQCRVHIWLGAFSMRLQQWTQKLDNLSSWKAIPYWYSAITRRLCIVILAASRLFIGRCLRCILRFLSNTDRVLYAAYRLFYSPNLHLRLFSGGFSYCICLVWRKCCIHKPLSLQPQIFVHFLSEAIGGCTPVALRDIVRTVYHGVWIRTVWPWALNWRISLILIFNREALVEGTPWTLTVWLGWKVVTGMVWCLLTVVPVHCKVDLILPASELDKQVVSFEVAGPMVSSVSNSPKGAAVQKGEVRLRLPTWRLKGLDSSVIPTNLMIEGHSFLRRDVCRCLQLPFCGVDFFFPSGLWSCVALPPTIDLWSWRIFNIHLEGPVGIIIDKRGPRAWISSFCPPRTHGAAGTEFDALDKESSHRLLVLEAAAS